MADPRPALEPTPSIIKLLDVTPEESNIASPPVPGYPATVDTVYPEESGVNIRITLFPPSATYKLPDISIVIPYCKFLN